MSSTTSQFSSVFHPFFNKEKTSAETETKLDLISSTWDDYHIWRLDEKTGNAYGVIIAFKEPILKKSFWRIGEEGYTY